MKEQAVTHAFGFDGEPIAVSVLSGFLGSGKTTLLNALLAEAQTGGAVPTAVIVNEFGSIGIDGALVAGGEQFVELDHGCLCCALNEDLVATLMAIVARGNIGRILIETTGLADPLPIGWACSRPGLADHLRLDAIVTLIDGRAGTELLRDHEIARLQVERADLVLISKCDVAADGGDAAALAARALNGLAPVLRGGPGAWPLAALASATPLGERSKRDETAPARTSRASGVDHDSAHGVEQWTWHRAVAAGPVDERAVEELTLVVPADVVRFKGLFYVDAKEGPWLLVHGVAGRIDLRFCSPPRPPNVSAIVFFGRALARAKLQALCDTSLLCQTTQ